MLPASRKAESKKTSRNTAVPVWFAEVSTSIVNSPAMSTSKTATFWVHTKDARLVCDVN